MIKVIGTRGEVDETIMGITEYFIRWEIRYAFQIEASRRLGARQKESSIDMGIGPIVISGRCCV